MAINLHKYEHQAAFDAVEKSLASSPVLILSDDSKTFSWDVMQVILPSVVPSHNLTMRAVSDS